MRLRDGSHKSSQWIWKIESTIRSMLNEGKKKDGGKVSRYIRARRISLAGRHPAVRLLQIRDNPEYAYVIIGRHFERKLLNRKHILSIFNQYRLLSGIETIRRAMDEDMSIARLSDGEFEQIRGGGEYPPDSNWSQRNSLGLRKDLLRLFRKPKSRLLVCIDSKEKIFGLDSKRFEFDQCYSLMHDIRLVFPRVARVDQIYGSAKLFLEEPGLPWKEVKEYMAKKHIVIATGNTFMLSGLQLGVTTDFVECGVDDAYARIDEIETDIYRLIKRNGYETSSVLVLASLGVTSTILAYRLTGRLQFWDTGHAFTLVARRPESIFKEQEMV